MRLLIVEDQNDLREYLFSLLEEDFDKVCCARDGEEGVRMAREMLPDVVLMDIGLPRMNGIEATKKIKELYPRAEVLILTVFEDQEKAFEAIKAGAKGYILKGSEYERIIEAIREVASGNSIIEPSIARKILDEFQSLASKVKKKEEEKLLSERETEILKLVAKGRSLQQIAEMLIISRETVKTHIKRIYEKLSVKTKGEAVFEGIRKGIISTEESS